MKINKKKISITVGIILIAALIFFSVWIMHPNTVIANRLPVYYYNPSSFRIEAEYKVLLDDTENTDLDNAIRYLFDSPRNASLQNIAPDREGFLTGYEVYGNTLRVYFTDAYYTFAPLDEALFRASFVWTVTEFDEIENVSFFVDGVDLLSAQGGGHEYYNRVNINILPEISWVRITSRTFVFYLINGGAEGLVKVERTIDNVDLDQKIERTIVEHLIEIPLSEDYYPAIPAETKILEITTTDGTCLINVSGDFNARYTGSQTAARLMIYSIVNTLIENIREVKRVRFTIDYNIVEQFQGLTEFNQLFEKDESLVLPEGLPQEEGESEVNP